MNREYKFRGKRLDNGEWVFGGIAYLDYYDGENYIEGAWITNTHNKSYEVDPDTVGQYTGLKDNNGKEIYEGDMTKDVDTGKTFEIMYHRHMFLRYERKPMYMFYTLDGDCLEVIGNIYDNPDLLAATSTSE